MTKYLYILMLCFTAITGFYFFLSWAQLPPGQRYIYPIDDVYIHLALARNFAELGVWSVNISGFDSASSSILYTLLLAGLIRLFGDWEYYPLLLNVVFGYLTVYSVYRYYKDFYGSAELKWAAALILFFPLLYVMVLIGMEHTIQMFLMVLAVYFIRRNVKSDFRCKDFLLLLTVTFFLSMVRFESMFFTVSLAFALFLRKNYLKGTLILVAGFIAIVVFGIISVQNGGFFFPNSVMVKGSYPAEDHIFMSMWQLFENGILLNVSFYKCLFFPLVIIAVYLFEKYRSARLKNLLNETLLIVVVLTSVLHALFAVLMYRYENYLMISLLLICIPIITHLHEKYRKTELNKSLLKILTLGSITAIVLISIYRFGYHHLPLTYMSKGINSQQVEMSRFLGKYYKGEKIVANDIGAISYFSGVQLLDIVGLGSTDIAEEIVRNKHLSAEENAFKNKKFIVEYAAKNKFKVAVIYPEWFPGGVPDEWIPVATWKIPEPYGPARQRIVFYALRSEEEASLRKNLMEFDRNPNVKQEFLNKVTK